MSLLQIIWDRLWNHSVSSGGSHTTTSHKGNRENFEMHIVRPETWWHLGRLGNCSRCKDRQRKERQEETHWSSYANYKNRPSGLGWLCIAALVILYFGYAAPFLYRLGSH
jgi:hypothetical protein